MSSASGFAECQPLSDRSRTPYATGPWPLPRLRRFGARIASISPRLHRRLSPPLPGRKAIGGLTSPFALRRYRRRLHLAVKHLPHPLTSLRASFAEIQDGVLVPYDKRSAPTSLGSSRSGWRPASERSENCLAASLASRENSCNGRALSRHWREAGVPFGHAVERVGGPAEIRPNEPGRARPAKGVRDYYVDHLILASAEDRRHRRRGHRTGDCLAVGPGGMSGRGL